MRQESDHDSYDVPLAGQPTLALVWTGEWSDERLHPTRLSYHARMHRPAGTYVIQFRVLVTWIFLNKTAGIRAKPLKV